VSAAQGQRMPGGFILITGQDGIRYALRPNQVAVVHDADECRTRPFSAYTAGTSSGCRARWKRCWVGSDEYLR
jgi:hypothetical protein